MKPTIEQLEKIAEWWAIKSFDTPLNQNNGDDSENGDMAFLLMNIVATQSKQTIKIDSRQKFKDSIIRQLSAAERFILDVDYHPNSVLAQACGDAEVDPGILPCKTFSDFRDGRFIAKYQYGGNFEEVG